VTRTGRRVRASLCCVLATCVLGGCSAGDDTAARSVAEQFLDAGAQRQGAQACSLLAPAAVRELEDASGAACEQAILEEDLGAASGILDVQVFDTMAQVRFETDTMFLSRFDGEWLVIAAACAPRPGHPYDCDIQVS
jgi:hypothetical protein